jgi:ABC-2 type transport system ATP-binding protein
LCDRVAVVDAGRLVAVDTPAGLVTQVNPSQRIRFRPSVQFEDQLLTDLPEVRQVIRNGAQIEVVGSGDLLNAVVSTLARNHIVASELRVEQANLDDAFVALTGQAANSASL